jgi:hypothetical protein
MLWYVRFSGPFIPMFWQTQIQELHRITNTKNNLIQKNVNSFADETPNRNRRTTRNNFIFVLRPFWKFLCPFLFLKKIPYISCFWSNPIESSQNR